VVEVATILIFDVFDKLYGMSDMNIMIIELLALVEISSLHIVVKNYAICIT